MPPSGEWLLDQCDFRCTLLSDNNIVILFIVLGVCLPGRESRFLEPLVDDWKSLVKDFCQDVHGILREKPFAFWGHRLANNVKILQIKAITYGQLPHKCLID